MVEINHSVCKGCSRCVEDCVERVIYLENGKACTKRVCLQCGHCVAICPVNAVSISEYDMEDVTEYDASAFTLNPEQFLNAVKFRRSIRKFKECRIEKEKLDLLAEAGRYTATAVNSQSTTYVFVQENLEKLKPLAWEGWLTYADTLPEEQASFAETIHNYYDIYQQDFRQDRLFFNAPALLIVATENPWDGGLAAQNMEMMAVAEGLGMLYNGFVLRAIKHNPKAMEWLGLTGRNIACSMLLGYPDIVYKRTAPRKKADIIWK